MEETVDEDVVCVVRAVVRQFSGVPTRVSPVEGQDGLAPNLVDLFG